MQLFNSMTLLVLTVLFECAAVAEQPNILIDDLGWKDVGYNGSRLYETPNIDRLASEGMVFTSGYAASPMCCEHALRRADLRLRS